MVGRECAKKGGLKKKKIEENNECPTNPDYHNKSNKIEGQTLLIIMELTDFALLMAVCVCARLLACACVWALLPVARRCEKAHLAAEAVVRSPKEDCVTKRGEGCKTCSPSGRSCCKVLTFQTVSKEIRAA